VPRGFSADHPVYDTTEAASTSGSDFNQDPNLGSGTDRTYYRVPVDGYQGEVTITAEVYYQSVPPNWVQDLFAFGYRAHQCL